LDTRRVSRPERYLYVLLACSAAAAAALAAASCAPARPRPTALNPALGPATLTITAPWRDIVPAVQVAVRQTELTIVSIEPGDRGGVIFELQSIAAEPGRLIATPAATMPDDRTPIPIRLEARIGLFGNQERQDALLRAVMARLGQLHGREWAPVP
jgi:hypothetical protein